MPRALSCMMPRVSFIMAAMIAVVVMTNAPPAHSVTRWSTIQTVPNADMIPGGRLLVDTDFAWEIDNFEFGSPLWAQRLQLGFSEWAGVEIGYANGFYLGMKARVVKENLSLWYAPSLVIGVQNLYSSREAFYFGRADSRYRYPRDEFYFAAAKSSEWARLRMHVGLMSAATNNHNDLVNPFAGIEKYFGGGFYVTAEAQRRDRGLLLSMFLVYRPMNDRFEFSVGALDVPGTAGRDEPRVYHPMARMGLRVLLGSGLNGLDGLTGIEDRIDRQRELIRAIDRRVDSVVVELRWSADRIHELSDFPTDGRREERARVLDELAKLRNLYDQIPFNPELVRAATDGIRDRYEIYSPHLRVIITDAEADPRLRRLAVSLIGDMNDRAAANILISILDRFEEPSLKIETMVALGKMRETRAREQLLRLRGDPNSGVSFTALEVYRLIFGDEVTEIQGPPSAPLRVDDDIEIIPERRLRRE